MEKEKDDSLYTYDRLSNFVKNYKAYINKKKKGDGKNGEDYDYYHFEVSPKGITSDSIGRIPSSFFSNITSWSPFATTNTINAWLMNLGKTNSRLIQNEDQRIKSLPVQPGLTFNVIAFPTNLYSNDRNTFYTNMATISNEFNELPTTSSNVVPLKTGSSSNLTSLQDSLQIDDRTNMTAFYSKILSSKNTLLGCEWNGFFRPTHVGDYRFTLNISGGMFFVWIGNKSVCEYTPYNSDLNDGNPTANLNISNDKYVPIRIQYYGVITPAILQNPVSFSFKVEHLNNDASVEIPAKSCLFTIDNGKYIPPILYCGFVSTSADTYAQGKFQCYSLLNSMRETTMSTSDLKLLYKLLNSIKYSVYDNTYDTNSDGIINYGELPNKMYYTPVRDTPSSLPEVFSIYRIDSDIRMGGTFQIDTTMNDGLYNMQLIDPEASPSILQYGNSYHEYSGYYPEVGKSGIITGSTQESGEQCKEKCNSINNCNHYYVYSSKGTDQCGVDTLDTTPAYNQILPKTGSIDEGSAALFVRNYQFTEPTCGKVPGTSQSDLIKLKTVAATNNYSGSFPYAKYNWISEDIEKIKDVGICGDKNYKRLTNDAASILYKDETYYANGTWSSGKEGFESEYTDAIEDTQNAINRNLQNEQLYADKMQHINQNYEILTNEKLPAYRKSRQILENNAVYDYNGRELSYFNDIPPNTIQQQEIDDNNELYVKDNLMYVLGSITAATLLVFAIMIAKE